MTYREFVLAGNAVPENPTHLFLGLCGEAGEVADLYKKSLYRKQPIDHWELLQELGDVRWYLEALCAHYGTSMEELERLNRAKLEERRK